MFWMCVEDFETVLKHIDDFISQREIQGGHFDLICEIFLLLLFCRGFSYCWIIQNSKLQHSKWRHKNEMLDETMRKPIQHENCVGWAWENVGLKTCLLSNFHPTRFFSIQYGFFFFCYFCVLLNGSNVSYNMAFLLCWMNCWIGLTRPLCRNFC